MRRGRTKWISSLQRRCEQMDWQQIIYHMLAHILVVVTVG
jgi:hypothetical protein